MVAIIMGVSGCGKTEIGRLLARELGWAFIDGDDLHPPGNVAKMAGGQPLTDADRRPWLRRVRRVIQEHLDRREPCLVACSALKQSYRDVLRRPDEADVRWVYLRVGRAELARRLAQRRGHFFNPQLLDSQLRAFEPPEPPDAPNAAAAPDAANAPDAAATSEGVITVDGEQAPAAVAAAVRAALGL
jgi:gluconokinase